MMGKLSSRPKVHTVMGVDCSTKSFAFTVFSDGEPVKYGKILFDGDSIYDRMLDAKRKIDSLSDELKVDYVVFEAAIVVRSVDVGIKMAYVFGTVLAELMDKGARVITVSPVQWQSYIGNKNWTKAQRAELKKQVPGKSDAWYKNEVRERRKQFTMDYFNEKFSLELTDNDVGDSMGLGYYGIKELTQ